MQLSLFGGTFLRVDGNVVVAEPNHEYRRGKKSLWVAEGGGFNVHAGVLVHAGDREGLERLCRYGARPPFSLQRICLLVDGRVAYLLKKPRRNGATQLVPCLLSWPPCNFLRASRCGFLCPDFPYNTSLASSRRNSSSRPVVVAMRPPPPIHNASAEPRPSARQRRPGTTRHRSANEPWRTTPVAMRRPHRLGLPHPQGIPPRRARLSLR